MTSKTLQEQFTDFLRNLAWDSFENRFSRVATLRNTYGYCLDALRYDAASAAEMFGAESGKRYRPDDLELRRVSPWIRPEKLFDLMHDSSNWSVSVFTWSLAAARIPSPFMVWFVHN